MGCRRSGDHHDPGRCDNGGAAGDRKSDGGTDEWSNAKSDDMSDELDERIK